MQIKKKNHIRCDQNTYASRIEPKNIISPVGWSTTANIFLRIYFLYSNRVFSFFFLLIDTKMGHVIRSYKIIIKIY